MSNYNDIAERTEQEYLSESTLAQHKQVIAELVHALNWFAAKHEQGTCGRQIAQDALARVKALEVA